MSPFLMPPVIGGALSRQMAAFGRDQRRASGQRRENDISVGWLTPS